MTRLWRYWPVRMAVLVSAALCPIFGGFLAAVYSGRGDDAAVIAAAAGLLACVTGWRAALYRLDEAARGDPPAWRSARQKLWTLAALPLPVVFLSAGAMSLWLLPPVRERHLIFEATLIGLLAVFPPLLFTLHAWPRAGRQRAYLGACFLALYATSLAAPFAAIFAVYPMAYLLTLLDWTPPFTGVPDTVLFLAWVALFYAALNIPAAMLLGRNRRLRGQDA